MSQVNLVTTAIGQGGYGIAIGGSYSHSHGTHAARAGSNSIAIGPGAVIGTYGVALGDHAIAGNKTVAIGPLRNVGSNAVAIGMGSTSVSVQSGAVAIGSETGGSEHSVSIGRSAIASFTGGIAIGKAAMSNGGVSIGNGSRVGNGGISIGRCIDALCINNSIVIGDGLSPSAGRELYIATGAGSSDSGIRISGNHIYFKINGTCKKVGRDTFFSKIGAN